MPPLTISFALWTYNGARYLPEQLASLSLQRRRPDELVVSDDASTDETATILRDYARHAPFPVRVVTNPVNLGPRRNFARAASLCTGQIIAPLGQDDIQHPEKLACIEAAFQQYSAAGLCFTNADLIDEHSLPLGETLWDRIDFTENERRSVDAGAIMAVLLRRNVVSGPTLAFRSEYRDRILPVPDGWWEDYWSAVVVGSMAPIVTIPRSLVQYRLHPGQQLGLPRTLRILNRVYAQWIAEFWSNARETIGQRLPDEQGRLTLSYVDDIIEHCRLRAALPDQRWRRLPTILREMFRGRYGRYSYGWASALSDLTYPSQALGAVRHLLSNGSRLGFVGRRLYGVHEQEHYPC